MTRGQSSHQEITVLNVPSCLMENADVWASCVYCRVHFSLISGKLILVSGDFHYKIHNIFSLGKWSKEVKNTPCA